MAFLITEDAANSNAVDLSQSDILPLARAQLREIATTATLAVARVTAAHLEDIAGRATAQLDG